MADVNSNSDVTIYCESCESNKNLTCSNFASHRLYYRKPEASSPKGYLQMADVNSNCDAVSYNRFAVANLVCECNEQNNITQIIL